MATFIKPYVDKENASTLSSSYRRTKSAKAAFGQSSLQGTVKTNSNITPKVFDNGVFTVPRKALGNLSNVKVRSSESKNLKKTVPYVDSPRPPPVQSLFGKPRQFDGISKDLIFPLDRPKDVKRNTSTTEEYPDIEYMPTEEDSEDNYEDIWPVTERLTLSDMRRLKTWKPEKPSLSEYFFEEEKLSPVKLESVTSLWNDRSLSDQIDEDSLLEDGSLDSVDLPDGF